MKKFSRGRSSSSEIFYLIFFSKNVNLSLVPPKSIFPRLLLFLKLYLTFQPSLNLVPQCFNQRLKGHAAKISMRNDFSLGTNRAHLGIIITYDRRAFDKYCHRIVRTLRVWVWERETPKMQIEQWFITGLLLPSTP